MGTIYKRGRQLWMGYKDETGEMAYKPTHCLVGEEKKAEKILAEAERKARAGQKYDISKLGPITVARFAEVWFKERQALGLADAKNDESRIREHVLTEIGRMRLEDVRPSHLVDLIRRLRSKRIIKGRWIKKKDEHGKTVRVRDEREEPLAPKTIHNIYSNLKALFRDAVLSDLIDQTPCILSKYQLGDNVDKNPEWRQNAIFTRDELEQLISDARLPEYRRVLYALEGLGALRLGEAAGLLWRHYDPTREPLGKLTIATSYGKGRTKTNQTRYMPVHATLAAILAEWKLGGWVQMMGRHPEPDDPILLKPEPKRGRRRAVGPMRHKGGAWEKLQQDLKALGLRGRRGHDLRRTMISLAQDDGAVRAILKECTHGRSRRDVIDDYTTLQWKTLCAEVAKLKIERKKGGELVQLREAAAGAEMVPSEPAAKGGEVVSIRQDAVKQALTQPHLLQFFTTVDDFEAKSGVISDSSKTKRPGGTPGPFPFRGRFLCFQTIEWACPVARAAVSRVSHPS